MNIRVRTLDLKPLGVCASFEEVVERFGLRGYITNPTDAPVE